MLVGGCSTALFAGSHLLGIASGIIVPVGAVFLFVAAIFAGRAPSRSLFFGLTTFVLAVGAVFMAFGDSKLMDGGVFISIFLSSIPMVVTVGLSMFFGMRGLKEISERLEEIRAEHLCELRQTHQCPGCGAKMDIVGRGLVVCSYCDAEVFLT